MASPQCTGPAPGPAPIRRLTRFELNNTLRDLLGDTTNAANQLPAEVIGNGFSNDAATITTTRALVDAYRSVASTLGAAATKDAPSVAKLTTCDVTTLGEDACRVRSGAAPQVLAGVRNAVVHLLGRVCPGNIAAAIRHLVAKPRKAVGLVYSRSDN